MSDRFTLKLTPGKAVQAHAWLARAISLWSEGSAWVMELREANRTDEQNDALHGLIDQIIKQRPVHNGIRMDKALWKAAFMQALGEEVRFIPTLDGSGVFPLGLSTKALSKRRFSELMEFVMAWMATEGLEIKHFDTDERKAAA